MKFYFSETLLFEDCYGIHFTQDHIGTNYRGPWDDFGHIITFKMFFFSDTAPFKKNSIGNIKILYRDGENTSSFFKSKGKKVKDKIFDITDILNIKVLVSIGEDINFYKKIKSVFNDDLIVNSVLEKICDASRSIENNEYYSKWDGYSGSFMRGSSSNAILKNGYAIACGNYVRDSVFDLNLNDIGVEFEPVTFRFNAKREVGGGGNICLLIGKNGVGKTHILKNLSELIAGVRNPDENNPLPCFNKIIIVAYSPFENFYTEKEIFIKLQERYSDKDSKPNNKSFERKRLHVNEYSYIGFRSEKGVFDIKNPDVQSAKSIFNIIKYDYSNIWWHNESKFELVEKTLKLSIDFDYISLTSKSGEDILLSKDGYNSREILRKEIDYEKGVAFKKNERIVPLSSGQKIYAYMIPSIISEIEDESLLVVDEPELYLHPELEVGLISMIKYILANTESFAIIATHSSILAREIKKDSITILRKNCNITKSYPPSIETYGESIDAITSEVFDDEYITKPYQKEIDSLLSRGVKVSKISRNVGNDALTYMLSKDSNDDITVEDE